MGMTTRAFGALALSSLTLLSGCFEEPAKLPPAASVSPTQTLNAVAQKDELISIHPYFVGKAEVKSMVVGIEGCKLFGLSAAQTAFGEDKKATVVCTTQDNKLAAQLVCMPTASGGGCLPNGHVATIKPE